MQRVLSGETELARAPEGTTPSIAVVASSFDPAFSNTLDGTITDWNSAAVALLGYTAEEVIGRSVGDLVPDDLRTELDRLFDRLRRGEAVQPFETVCLAKNGGRIAVLLAVRPVREQGGNIAGAVSVVRDINAPRLDPQDRGRSREILASLLENASEALHWAAPDGTLLWANHTELELFGYAKPDYVGRRITEFHADPSVAEDLLHHLADGQELRGFEARIRCRDGSIKHVSINSNVYWEHGRIVHSQCFTRDVTDRKLAEARLATEHAVARVLRQSSSLVEAAPGVLGAICENMDWALAQLWLPSSARGALELRSHFIVRPSPELEQFLENSRPLEFSPGVGMTGLAWQKREPLWVADIAADPRFHLAQRTTAAGLRSAVAIPILAGDESIGVMTFFATHSTIPSVGLFDVLAAISGDIADSVLRWRVEQERKRLADIAQASYDAIIGWDLDGTITSWNPAAETMYGYAAGEAIGQSILMLVPEDRQPDWHTETEQIRQGHAHMRVETVRVRKDGGHVDVSLTVSPLRNGRGEVIGAATIARDITERKRAAQMRDLLVRELSHRLKNVLAVVQSIAFLSLRNSPSLEVFQQSFDDRLRSLARIYDHLARVEWGQVDLRTLAMLSLEPYREAVATSGNQVMLTATEAATLGMVLHELATNAIKHGALSVPGGRVSFTWQDQDLGLGPLLILRWTEENGPRVVPPTKKGMGTRMIDVSVRHSFGGEVRVDYAESGVCWEIFIPRRELGIQSFTSP